MSSSTTADFHTLLEKCKLFTTQQLEELFAGLRGPSKPDQVVSELLRRGWCTRWQARQLLKGEHNFHLLGDKYKLLEKLGSGGMGTVYRAENTRLGQEVAIKVLSPNLVKNEEAKARFQREIKTIATLRNHPNIVGAHGADWQGDVYIFEMEFVPGMTLSQWMHKFGALPIEWACECIRQAAVGLQYAHERGIVHRDIKPGNLLVNAENLTSRPHVKILDMGLARVTDPSIDDKNQKLTRQGQVLGTPEYMAPEQALNTRGADVRADIYSLGCSLFRVLTREYPFPGNTPVEKIRARLQSDPPPVSQLRPEVPPTLDAVVAKMTARNPDDRYQSPQELAEALEPFVAFASWHDEGDPIQMSQEGILSRDSGSYSVTTPSAAIGGQSSIFARDSSMSISNPPAEPTIVAGTQEISGNGPVPIEVASVSTLTESESWIRKDWVYAALLIAVLVLGMIVGRMIF